MVKVLKKPVEFSLQYLDTWLTRHREDTSWRNPNPALKSQFPSNRTLDYTQSPSDGALHETRSHAGHPSGVGISLHHQPITLQAVRVMSRTCRSTAAHVRWKLAFRFFLGGPVHGRGHFPRCCDSRCIHRAPNPCRIHGILRPRWTARRCNNDIRPFRTTGSDKRISSQTRGLEPYWEHGTKSASEWGMEPTIRRGLQRRMGLTQPDKAVGAVSVLGGLQPWTVRTQPSTKTPQSDCWSGGSRDLWVVFVQGSYSISYPTFMCNFVPMM